MMPVLLAVADNGHLDYLAHDHPTKTLCNLRAIASKSQSE